MEGTRGGVCGTEVAENPVEVLAYDVERSRSAAAVVTSGGHVLDGLLQEDYGKIGIARCVVAAEHFFSATNSQSLATVAPWRRIMPDVISKSVSVTCPCKMHSDASRKR